MESAFFLENSLPRISPLRYTSSTLGSLACPKLLCPTNDIIKIVKPTLYNIFAAFTLYEDEMHYPYFAEI